MVYQYRYTKTYNGQLSIEMVERENSQVPNLVQTGTNAILYSRNKCSIQTEYQHGRSFDLKSLLSAIIQDCWNDYLYQQNSGMV